MVPCRDKSLQKTKSWSTNLTVVTFFKIKPNEDKNEFLERINGHLMKECGIEMQAEKTGYLTVIDRTPVEKVKKQHVQKEVIEAPAYSKYFDEHCPMALNEGKPKHEYTVKITRAMYTEETHEVYKKYQIHVHEDKKKEMTRESYERFLCQVPLFDKNEPFASEDVGRDFDHDDRRERKDEGVWPAHRGGYHMEHRIDGRLFAVSVIDTTPRALSSVYLYYDPEYEFLSPGTFCALREIEYMKRIQKDHDAEFKKYYLGLYFQDCQKSVYKANFKPAFVSCPVTHNYV